MGHWSLCLVLTSLLFFTAAAGLFQYFLKVVPTSYTTLHNNTIPSNQFRCGRAPPLPIVFPTPPSPHPLHLPPPMQCVAA